ncbi:MAG: T9SS type A sorting domain-containing protein [Acidobacteriota bacterium]
MKKVTLMFLTLLVVSAFYSQINAQILLDENFDYTVGKQLDSTAGWTWHSGTGAYLKVMTGNLTYANYPLVNKGGMITLVGQTASGEDLNHAFEKQSTGAMYTSFLVKVDTASLGDYFFHYKYNGGSSIFLARTYVKGNGNGTFKFGLSKAKSDTVYTTQSYKYGETILLVVKYEYVNNATGTDDKLSLYVNPDITKAEPTTADISLTSAAVNDTPLDAVALRQGNDIYKLSVDGIRVAKLWDNLKGDLVAPVVFQANMKVQILEKKFTPGTDKVVIRGDFQTVAGDAGGNWQGTKFELQDPDKDSIYTLTVDFPVAKVDTNYQYKLVLAPDSWESADNKPFTPALPVKILNPVYFSNDTVVNLPSPNIGRVFTVNFSADISSILGSGVGYFDPSAPRNDSITVQGLDWDGLGKEVKGSRKMAPGLAAGIYETSLTFTALSDSVKWKFRAFPENHFGDNGWEDSKDRWIVFGKDSLITIPTITPKIAPAQPAITKDIKVLFQVNMNGAVNSYNNKPIPKADIYFVGVKGADSVIGAWGGSWVVADTASNPKTMLVLNDKGVNGDKVAGDNIWSLEVLYKAGSAGGIKQFKYGCWYKGADSATTATAKLDNESAFQTNHTFMLKDEASGRIENLTNFGSMTVGVKELTSKVPTAYSLTQNYPNPFNPSTTIRYAVPQAGLVTLKIFNMLGQEVATLVHAQQNAGSYEVSFDASRLSSGIYLYNLTSGSFSSTKKMMLVK